MYIKIKSSMKKYFPFFFLFISFACKQSVEPTVYQVDKGLQIYLDKFTEEAKKRKINIATENLILKFGNTTEQICGRCIKVKNDGQRTVTIIDNLKCWQETSYENREALVFHELAHCLLGRVHRDDFLPNGIEASIMNSKGSGFYEPCIYDITGNNDCNKTYRRTYYIDELFNEKTDTPDWGK